jgi:hypothetical protein
VFAVLSSINPATKHVNAVILSNAKNLAFHAVTRSFTEPVLSITTRFFAALRMTCEGFRMTIIIAGLIDALFGLLPPIPFQRLPFVLQIQSFNLVSGPRGFSQKLEAGLDAWVIIKTSDIDDSSHFMPAIMLCQLGKNHFQGNTV